MLVVHGTDRVAHIDLIDLGQGLAREPGREQPCVSQCVTAMFWVDPGISPQRRIALVGEHEHPLDGPERAAVSFE